MIEEIQPVIGSETLHYPFSPEMIDVPSRANGGMFEGAGVKTSTLSAQIENSAPGDEFSSLLMPEPQPDEWGLDELQSDGADETPIIVNGQRINYGGGGAGGTSSFFTATRYAEEDMLSPEPSYWPAPDEPDDYDPPKVAADVDDPAKADEVQRAAQAMTDEVDRLTDKINALANDAQIRLADGKIISGAELKTYWNTIDFVVTDRSDFGSGRSGAFDAATRITTFNASDFLGWGINPGGLAFIILHEVVHSSAAGQYMNQMTWDMHNLEENESVAYGPGSMFFQENEEYSNLGALEIFRQIDSGSVPTFDPTYGYEFGDLDN